MSDVHDHNQSARSNKAKSKKKFSEIHRKPESDSVTSTKEVAISGQLISMLSGLVDLPDANGIAVAIQCISTLASFVDKVDDLAFGLQTGRIYSRQQLMSAVGISKGAFYNLLNDGMPFINISGQHRFSGTQVIAWLESRSETKTAVQP